MNLKHRFVLFFFEKINIMEGFFMPFFFVNKIGYLNLT
jgi:hypothetical protein